jgi:hypothetical protein
MSVKPKVRFLVPVWGKHYIERFTRLSLPSLLASGNLPALSNFVELEIVILTASANYVDFKKESTFQALRRIAPFHFVAIDDLIIDQLSGVILTLAYLRGVTETRADMVNRHFLFMNSDIVLADGSLRSVAKHILDGRRIILANSIRAVSEDVEEPLRSAVDQERHTLTITPRELVAMAMKSLHPTQIAKIINNDLCHSIHVNQFYWQVDANTMISRHFLMFMLCLKPERIVTEVHAFCDYSFVPEMCPSGGAIAMEDSDDFFALEMQLRESESDFLRIGRPTVGKIAESLSRWTTQVHREDSLNHTLIFHSRDLPAGTEAMCREADRFIREIHQHLAPAPKPYRHHPYWDGAYSAWQARKALLSRPQQAPAEPGSVPPSPRITPFKRIGRALYRMLLGCPPFVRIWHPDWLDYRFVAMMMASHLNRSDRKILYVKQHAGLFDHCIGAVEVATVTQVLSETLGMVDAGRGNLTFAIVELKREEIRYVRKITEHLQPLMAPGGQMLVFFKEFESACPLVGLEEELMSLIGYVAPVSLHETKFVFAGGIAKKLLRKAFDWAELLYRRHGFLAFPIVGLIGLGTLALATLNNVRQSAVQDKRAPLRHCSSFTMTINGMKA